MMFYAVLAALMLFAVLYLVEQFFQWRLRERMERRYDDLPPLSNGRRAR